MEAPARKQNHARGAQKVVEEIEQSFGLLRRSL
jgi:hypothetical protein